MKKQNQTTQTFRLRFHALIYALCVVAYLLCAAGIVLSVLRIIKYGIEGFSDVIRYPFLIGVCLFCIVLVTGVLVRSQYVIDGETLITQFGFVKSKFSIKEITSLLYDPQTKKMTVQFGEPYMVLSADPEWQERFVREILAVNPSVDYGFTLSDPTNKKEK